MDEDSPFILPPVPRDFRVSAAGIVAEVEPQAEPEFRWLGYFTHFSNTSLRLLKVCPEAYRQRYVLGKKERPGEALTVGKAVHGAVGHNLRQKLTTHEDLPVGEVVEYYHDLAWPKAVELDGGEDEIRWDGKPAEARRDGERMTQAYHKVVTPTVQPITQPEEKITVHVDGVPVPFIGYLDVEEEANVADVKTGKQVQRKPDSNWRIQGAIYSLAKRKPTHFHSVSRAKPPSIATPLTDPQMVIPWRPDIGEVTARVLRDYTVQVEMFMNHYGPDQPWPTTGVFMDYKGGAACGYCGFRKTCVAWAWEREVIHP